MKDVPTNRSAPTKECREIQGTIDLLLTANPDLDGSQYLCSDNLRRRYPAAILFHEGPSDVEVVLRIGVMSCRTGDTRKSVLICGTRC
jgi:hypothetical protein